MMLEAPAEAPATLLCERLEGGSIQILQHTFIQVRQKIIEVPQKTRWAKKRAFSKPYINVFGFINHTYIECG